MRQCIGYLALAAAVGCGGRVIGADAGQDASGSDAVVETDGWTACSSPRGAVVCGGPNQCDPACPTADAGGCGIDLFGGGPDGSLRECTYPDAPLGKDPSGSCAECEDSFLCIDPYPGKSGAYPSPIACVSPDYGVLYQGSGYGKYVSYADHGTYTNSSLPSPATCPPVAGITLCGGSCGSCPPGYVCVGRSPLHPYSLCVNDESQTPPNTGSYCHRGVDHCDSGRECFTFKVDDAAQPLADGDSLCVDQSICQAAAAGYPGGAYCTP